MSSVIFPVKLITSLTSGFVTLKLVFTTGNVVSGVVATVIIVSFVLKLPLVSFTLAVKFMTQHAAQSIVIFWLNSALVPAKVKLKYLINDCPAGEAFIIICPTLKPTLSVAFALRLIISFWSILVNDLFRLVFTTGFVTSATTINVEFCLTLLLTTRS